MKGVKAYLDANFRTREDLKDKLDQETGRLKCREEEIGGLIEKERESVHDSQQENVVALRTYFEGLSNDMFTGVPSDRDLRDKLEPFAGGSQLRVDCQAKFRNLQTWAKGYQVVERLSRLVEAKVQMTEALGNEDEQKAIGLFKSLLEDERVLKVFSKSTTPVIAKLATKGLDELNNNFRNVLKERFESQLKEFLKSENWPKSVPKDDQRFVQLVSNMIVTEHAEENPSARGPEPLDTFRVLVEQLDIRFQFHFEGDRETNRLDKPEWMFSHFITVVDEYYEMLTTTIQRALNEAERFKDRNGVHEFITALLQAVYRKLDKSFPQTVQDHKLLSHLVYETVAFDNQLKERYFYLPYGDDSWRGVSGDMLAKGDWFEKWLTNERETSRARYQEIIESNNAFSIDWEAVGPNETKPTVSAINLKDLLEGITEHYSSLRSVNYRLRFLLDIQIDLLDRYYEKLRDSIDAFDSMSSSLVRAVGGMSAESDKVVTGISGLERLCRIYGSLEYIASALETWGQDLFFLELWNDISTLSTKNKRLDSKVSQAVGDSSATIPENEDDEGTLFDETVASYNKLKHRVTLTISSVLKKELQHSMSDYFKSTVWKTDVKPTPGEISSKLNQPIKTMSKELAFLRSFHTRNDFILITRSFASDLSRYVWNYIIQSNQFTAQGAQQLSNDIAQLWTDLLLPRDASLRKIEQAVLVLTEENARQKPESQLQDDLGLTDLTLDDIRGIVKRIY